jgi:hypothetical protein
VKAAYRFQIKMVSQFDGLEKQLGIFDLAKFTPTS